MIWSVRVMSNRDRAFFSLFVISISFLLGSAAPEGWLWDIITCEASNSRARFVIRRLSTTVACTPPWLILMRSKIRDDEVRNRAQHSSCCSPSKVGRRTSTASLQLRICVTSRLSCFAILRPSSAAAAIFAARVIPNPSIILKREMLLWQISDSV